MKKHFKNSKHENRSARNILRIIKPAILTSLMLFLTILAIRGNGVYPDAEPRVWYWTDDIVEFISNHKEAIAVILSLLSGLFMYARLPDGSLEKIFTVISAILIPGVSFIFVEAYNRGFWHVGASLSYTIAEPFNSMVMLNLLIYYLFYLFLTFLLGSFRRGYCTGASLLMAVAIVNYYVIEFRGSPLVPWDFLSMRTAENVAADYEYTIYWQMLLSTFGFVFILLSSGKMRGKIRLFRIRVPALFISAAALFLVIFSLQYDDIKEFWGLDTTLFTPNVRYTKNGFWAAYLANLSFLNVEKPEGYSIKKVEEIASEAEESYNSHLTEQAESTGVAESTEQAESAGVAESTEQAESTEVGESTEQAESTEVAESTEQASVFSFYLVASENESESDQEVFATDGQESDLNITLNASSGTSSDASSGTISDISPNIIVIMNEAFSDLSVLGDFSTSEDYMPYFRSLMENFTSGHLLVSVKGGNTANTEYEFLSGDTTAFLPAGSVVFQQYISSELPTIASYLKGLGYSTVGMHPYDGSGWERDRVYPLMGFDEFLDISDFSGAKKLRNYVSDEGAFDKIIEVLEDKEADTPLFCFEVTMQNHSGFSPKSTDNGFSEEVMLTDADTQSASVIATERYLTLIKYSDSALQYLISYIEANVKEPTIVVMFGDHEPGDYITQVIDKLTGNDTFTTASDNSGASSDNDESLADVEKHYQVPFVIWNNFGALKDREITLTSPNYLAAMVLEEASLPLSAYDEFLLEMQKEVPAVAAGAYVDDSGVYHSWSEIDSDAENFSILNDYNILEYNHLIDVSGRVESVFADPLY